MVVLFTLSPFGGSGAKVCGMGESKVKKKEEEEEGLYIIHIIICIVI